MTTFIVVIHIIVCFALIMIVLFQTGKGSDMGAAFGGSSQTIFGSAGPGTFLGKLTAGAAIIFMLTSLSLAYLSTRKVTTTIFKETPTPEATESLPPSGEKEQSQGPPASEPIQSQETGPTSETEEKPK